MRDLSLSAFIGSRRARRSINYRHAQTERSRVHDTDGNGIAFLLGGGLALIRHIANSSRNVGERSCDLIPRSDFY